MLPMHAYMFMTKLDFLKHYHETLSEAILDVRECSEDLCPEFAMRQCAYWRGYLRGLLTQAYHCNIIDTDTYTVCWNSAKSELDGVVGEVLFHE